MTDNKRKINITVKKTISPFLFPESPENSNNSNSNSNSNVVISNGLSTNSSQTPSTTPAVPEKRKRGRPRLSKEAKEAKENGKDTGKKSTESVGSEEPNVVKKRGRKPKNQNLLTNIGDRVYGLNSSKPTIDLDNFENLSYVIDLKITKEQVEDIIEEICHEKPDLKSNQVKLGENTDSEKGKNTDNNNNNNNKQTAIGIPSNNPFLNLSMNPSKNLDITRDKALEISMTSGTESVARVGIEGEGVGVMGNGMTTDSCESCSKCPVCSHCKSENMNKSQPLSDRFLNYEQVDVDLNEIGHGYLDCYVGEIMPGFIDKDANSVDRWPLTSKYPCRNCDEHFTTTPAGLVQKIFGDYEMDPMRCKFFLYLNFCNWSCAARYAFDRVGDWVNQHNMMNLCYNTIMKKIDSKHTWRKVEMAPELGTLTKNGGELSIDDYRNLTNTNISYTIYIAPLIPLRMTLEETSVITKNQKHKNKDRVVLVDRSRVMRAEQSIKNKKESNRGNTIDRLMKVELK